MKINRKIITVFVILTTMYIMLFLGGCVAGSSLSRDEVRIGKIVYLDSPGFLHGNELKISDGTVLRDGDEGEIINSGSEYYSVGYAGYYPCIDVRFRGNIEIHFMQENLGTIFLDYKIHRGYAIIDGKQYDFAQDYAPMWKVRTQK